jgi:hypothetical protein
MRSALYILTEKTCMRAGVFDGGAGASLWRHARRAEGMQERVLLLCTFR